MAGNVHGVCSNGSCHACGSDATCTASTAYGAGYICLVGTGDCVQGTCHDNGDCAGKICNGTHACAACATKADCTTAYGSGYVCQTSSGKCVQGSCNTNGDCGAGQICSGTTCSGCGTSDTACTTAYGSGYICVSGSCVTGTCHDGSQCTDGKACSLSTHTCGNCSSDTECQASYGAGFLCGTRNTCIPGNCHTDANCTGQRCVNNVCTPCTGDTDCTTGQVCIGGTCVTGNCHDKSNCSTGQVCTNNNCASCANDGQCIDAYGVDICQSGSCIAGNCHAKGDCNASSQLCNTTTHFCGACTTDAQCGSEYGGTTKQLCISNICVSGSCHDSGTCTGGQVCGTSHTCGACASDSDCHNDAKYGSGYLCQAGACTAGTCRTAPDCGDTTKICSNLQCTGCGNNTDCTNAYGANHVCSGGQCVSGTCNSYTDCGGTGQICVNHACVACNSDTECSGQYGSAHICENHQCIAGTCHSSSDCTGTKQLCNLGTHTCVACASDTACRSDSAYGSTTICLGMVCETGNCHDNSADCTGGQLCNNTSHTCGACGTDTQCTTDTHYGSGDICYQGACLAGNCHADSTDCTGTNLGRICGVSTPETCGSCTTDAQCQADPHYGPGTICTTTAGTDAGKCVSAACSTNSAACAANSGDFCCSSACVAGNCCANADCINNPSFGAGYACVGNTCSHCDAISGNTYYVDPVNGDDTSATGSRKSGGATVAACAFKTLTRALQVIGTSAGAGTKVVITNAGASAIGLSGDTLPITVQPNVTITNSGPVTITLAAANGSSTNVAGFNLNNVGSGISGSTDPSSPLILDGGNNTSGIAVNVSSASAVASLSNVTIQNTKGHAITVSAGTLNIGAGLLEKNAGTASLARDGLLVSGGTVNITVASGGSPTEFTMNNQSTSSMGIEVSGTGALNVTGSATTPPNGNGTVVVSYNGQAGVYIHQTPATAVQSTLNGLVSWGNNSYGARILAGSKVKIRNSVFGATTYGVLVQNSGSNYDLSNIDLGSSSDPGNNWLQTTSTQLGHNATGVCVSLGGALATPATASGTLQLAGDEFVSGAYNNPAAQTQLNCATSSGTVTKNTTTSCSSSSNQPVAYGHGTYDTVTVSFDMCN